MALAHRRAATVLSCECEGLERFFGDEASSIESRDRRTRTSSTRIWGAVSSLPNWTTVIGLHPSFAPRSSRRRSIQANGGQRRTTGRRFGKIAVRRDIAS